MKKVTSAISMSLDAFVAGPNQSFEKPFGDIPEDFLHHWMFDEPEKHQAEINALTDAGAFIMGSNMFGPKEKRESPDWKGWWGDNPVYHAPVFVLSHKQRDPIAMEGGTTYIFIADGIEAALSTAKEAAGQRNVAIMGGANTINQYLSAGLLDDTVPDMSDQWCTAYFKRFKLQIGNILKETCSRTTGDGRDVEP